MRPTQRSSSQSSPRSGLDVKIARGGGASRGAAARKPIRQRCRVIVSGRDQNGAIPGEPPKIPRLFQITGGIVQPEQPSPRFSNKANDAVPAAADVQVTGGRYSLRQRRPLHAVIAECCLAAIAHGDLMAAPRQSLCQCRERCFGPAERALLCLHSVKLDAVIGHHHFSHFPP